MSDMETNTPTVESEETKSKLPIDLHSLVVGIARRWMLVLAGGLVSLPIALFVALNFSEQVYRAETVMLYTPPPTTETEERAAPSLFTQISMIKVRSNLERVRQRLQLGASVKSLGAAVEANLESKTTLITIRTKWGDAEEAAAIANTVREVFLESQEEMIRGSSREKIAKLEKSIATISEELHQAEEALNEFTNKNQIVDLTQQIQWSLEELTSVNLLLESAMMEKVTVDKKMNNIERIISELEERVAKEKAESSSSIDALSEIGIRLERLQDSIRLDKETRSYDIQLEEAARQLERAKELHAEGAISEEELNAAQARYDERKVWGEDTDQIKEWKAEIEKLDQVVIPKEGTVTPSGKLLQDVQFERFKLELEQVAAGEKVESFARAKSLLEERLRLLPDQQRTFVELSRTVEIKDAAKKSFEADLSRERRYFDATATPFITLVEAVTPSSPTSSNKKMLFLAVVVLITGASFALVVLRVLVDITLKTENEAELRLGIPCLAGFPDVQGLEVLLPNGMTPQFIETFRILARAVRGRVPKRGARLMVVSAGHDEGTTFVAVNMATIFGRTDERVLVIDAQVRPIQPERSKPTPKRFDVIQRIRILWRNGLHQVPQSNRLLLHDLLHDSERGKSRESELGLGDYLSFRAATMEEIVRKTRLPNVDVIPLYGAAVVPDMLGTNRMRELLQEASNTYSIVVIDAPPVLHFVDAEALAGLVDGVLFVARAHHGFFPAINHALNRLNAQGVPVIGTVLNRIKLAYMSRLVEGLGHENSDHQ
ncbi:MAG: hypothetical protein SFY68_12920 [Candidatus Sumerlaeia bacterium]|nr:hypothetical protein [Candidatus Sumerlaeia bacterium]